MKIAIVIDSASGLSKQQTEKLGWYLLPLQMEIDGKNYMDGLDLVHENFFNIYKKESKAKTSTFNIAYATDLFTNLSKEYDKILVYPISKYLSSSYALLKNMESDFPKLRIIESVQIAQLMTIDLLLFEEKNIQNENSFEEAVKIIEQDVRRQSITLMPKYNDYLVKGGRLHPSAALIAKLLKIVPMIKWDDGQLKKEGKGIVFNKTVKKCIQSKQNFYETLQLNNRCSFILHSNSNNVEEYAQAMKHIYQESPIISYIPNVICIHTGPEAITIINTEVTPGVKKKLEEIYSI